MSKADQTITIDGQTFHVFPTLKQFIKEAGIDNATASKQILVQLRSQGIEDVSQLFSFAMFQLIELGITKRHSLRLFKHLQLIRRRTPLIIKPDKMRQLAKEYTYLHTANTQFDRLLTHANLRLGLRSKSLVEFYGEAGIGKTQLLITLAVMCIKNWQQPVLYIDSEGTFDLHRFYQIAAFYEVDIPTVDRLLSVARAYSFDDVDQIITEIAVELRQQDLGMIVLDSIIDPLKAQYPIDDDFTLLQQRQQHLKQVCDRLKSLAQVHNFVVIFSNQVRSAMDETDPDRIVPQGGNVLAHSTDMRLWIKPVIKSDQEWYEYRERIVDSGLSLVSIELVDCGFLPTGTADMLIGPFGTADPTRWKQLVKQAQKQDHRSINTTSVSGKQTQTLKQLKDQIFS